MADVGALETTAPKHESDTNDAPQWASSQDPENPFNYPTWTKWMITLTACYVTLIVGLNATSITSASIEINERFNVSDTQFPNSYWPVTSWGIGAALAPMVILPIMEANGMRPGYLVNYVLFVAFVIPQAVAQNFATFIICRFFAGCCGGVLQTAMDGLIADIWEGASARSNPVSCYVFFLLAGVALGPVLGGAVAGSLYWRWMLYIQLILYGVSAPVVFFTFRETRGPVILAKRAKRAKANTYTISHVENPSIKEFIQENVVRPAYLLCTEPVVFVFTLLSGLSYGLVFISTQSVVQVFTTNYHWAEYQAGLVQTSIFVGELFGFLACLLQDHLFARAAARSSPSTADKNLPEVRLYTSIPGSFIGLAGGLFWYGWTSYSHLHWILPSIGLAIVGFGSVVVMQAIMMYVTDSYAKYAASASAAICFGENMFAAFLPLCSLRMYTDLGFQWASSLLAFVAFALSFAPVALVIWGRQIRKRSPFMLEAAYD